MHLERPNSSHQYHYVRNQPGIAALDVEEFFHADIGTETAIAWIEQNSTSGVLQNDVTGQGYLSSWVDPTSGQTLDSFWTQQLKPYAVGPSPTDSAGNQVSYVIQRLCASSGDPLLGATGCAITIPSSSSQNLLNSVTASSTQLPAPGEVYYRITSRIDGPRGAVSYVQTIVAK